MTVLAASYMPHRSGQGFRLPHMQLAAGVLATLVVAADLLFFNGPVPGLSLLLFHALIGAGMLALHAARRGIRIVQFGAGAAIVLAALLPLAETATMLSFAVSIGGLALAALALSGTKRRTIADRFRAMGAFFITVPYRFIADSIRWRRAILRLGRPVVRYAALAVWAMPVALTLMFLFLFGAANPVIERLLTMIDLWALLELLDIWRILFWTFIAIAVWPFLKPKLPRFMRRKKTVWTAAAPIVPVIPPNVSVLFGPSAILRALVLFNILFAFQTILDAAYLWGGMALPDGMTYAEYAHRGAYPLIVTALLAAAFVLLAMRPDSATSANPVIRMLVYAWVAQNIVLVISSILRLDLYVGVYSLTYWRIAAFIWMGLVAAGLAFIIARIALGKSGDWLVGANVAAASVVLYACCFVNFAALIANWNVDHSRQAGGPGQPMDTWYLTTLGPHALPATERFLALRPELIVDERQRLEECLKFWTSKLEDGLTDWHSWTFRDWRLQRSLLNKGYGNASRAIMPPMNYESLPQSARPR